MFSYFSNIPRVTEWVKKTETLAGENRPPWRIIHIATSDDEPGIVGVFERVEEIPG